MKNRTEGEIIIGRTCDLARMKLCGILFTHQVLDNEASSAYKELIRQSGMTYQLVPPDEHRRNHAGKSIPTWKYQFIGVLCGMEESFPMYLWCQLTPQSERKLLFLRQAYSNPNVSMNANLHSPHAYSAKHFFPLVMEAMIHEKPNRRQTFASQCLKAYVLGTLTKNYCCWKLWVKETCRTIISGKGFSNTNI